MQLISGLNNNQIVNFCNLNQERGSENSKLEKKYLTHYFTITTDK